MLYLIEIVGKRSRVNYSTISAHNQAPIFPRKGEWAFGFEVADVMWDMRNNNFISIKVWIDD